MLKDFKPSPRTYFSFAGQTAVYRCLYIDPVTVLYEDHEGDRFMASGTEDFEQKSRIDAHIAQFNVGDDEPGPLWPLVGDLFIYQHNVYQLTARVGDEVAYETAEGEQFTGELSAMSIRIASPDDAANFHMVG